MQCVEPPVEMADEVTFEASSDLAGWGPSLEGKVRHGVEQGNTVEGGAFTLVAHELLRNCRVLIHGVAGSENAAIRS